MSARPKILLVVAVVFTLLNVAALVMAALAGELLHTAAHAALTVLGALAAAALAHRRRDAVR